MKIQDIIDYLESDASWVNWRRTRDHVLFGNSDKPVTGIGVCWVLTHQAIDMAVENNINFMITHENPFYLSSTQLHTNLYNAIKGKEERLKKEHITVYRCHDLWDCYPDYGIADMWANQISSIVIKQTRKRFITTALVKETTVRELALLIAKQMIVDGENGVYVIGDLEKKVSHVALGTGAATDVFEMDENSVDVFVVSEDGMNCWSSGQYVVDQNKALIIVSHCCCEKSGLKELAKYLKKQFVNIDVEYIDDGINATFIALDQ